MSVYLDVRDFGTVANGTTDDSAAIQAAINAAISQKKRLEIPAGQYKITTGLVINGPVEIYGAWSGSLFTGTHLLCSGTTKAISITCEERVLISGIHMTGSSGAVNAIVTEYAGSYTSFMHHFIRCRAVTFTGAAFYQRNGELTIWDNCVAYGCGIGFLADQTSNGTGGAGVNCEWRQCRAFYCTGNGFDIDQNIGFRLIGCQGLTNGAPDGQIVIRGDTYGGIIEGADTEINDGGTLTTGISMSGQRHIVRGHQANHVITPIAVLGAYYCEFHTCRYISCTYGINFSSTTNTYHMIFDQNVAFYDPIPLTSKNARVRIIDASSTDTGVVTTGAQTFAGKKTMSQVSLVSLSDVVTLDIQPFATQTNPQSIWRNTAGTVMASVGFDGTFSASRNLTYCEFVGNGSGNAGANTGTYNTGVGAFTLHSNTTGINNTGIGSFTLYSTTTGTNNTGVGALVLFENTTGTNNTGFGSQSLKENRTGSYNIAFGTLVLLNSVTGDYNTSAGYQSIYSNTSGSSNTAFGAFALYDLGSEQTAGAFHSGTSYTIKTVGTTDFTLIGAASNTIGVVFTASGAGTGTGTATPNSINANTAIGHNTGRGIIYGTGNTIIGANVSGLPAGLTNTVVIADSSGNQRIVIDSAGVSTVAGQLIHTPPASATLSINGQVTLEVTSNTAGNFVFRGSDGVTRRSPLVFS